MPRGDRTGPWGMGPMTGRGAGYCAGFPVPGYLNPGFGRLGGGFGWGRGYRHRYWATGVPGRAYFGPGPGAYPAPWGYPFDPTAEPVVEEKFLRQQARLLEKQLQETKDQLAALEKQISGAKTQTLAE